MNNKTLPVLIDFDGVLKLGENPAQDAHQFLSFLKENNFPSIILSNSTLYNGSRIKEFLKQNEINIEINCITTVDASLEYLKQKNLKAAVYCNDIIHPLFNDFSDNENPDVVLIGDLGSKWNYNLMNEIFRKVMNGADIIAMQKNKFWKPADELCLDVGAFIASIEYASGKKSTLIGKPSPLYFQMALKKLGFDENKEFIMIGDDIETDIDAAQKINGKGILVFTGKTKFPLSEEQKIVPYSSAQNLTEVITFFQKMFWIQQHRDHQDQIKHPGN